jgi:hypothetical protein
MPEHVSIDHRDDVEEIGGAALASELEPAGWIPAVAGYQNTKVSSDVGSKPLAMTIEGGFAQQ